MALAAKKIALVHVAKSRLGLSEDVYRDTLRNVAGVESSTKLNDLGFELLMDYFAGLGFVSDARANDLGMRRGMATPAQVALIEALWREYTKNDGTGVAMGRWLHRSFGVSALRFVTAEKAPKVITALKAMNGRETSATS